MSLKKVSFVVLIISLFMLGTFSFGIAQSNPEPVELTWLPIEFPILTIDYFNLITLEAIVSAPLSSESIDGSDNEKNQIPEGTIVLYKTDENRYGKLKILDYDYNLEIKYVTYNADGSVFSSSNSLVIKGTWIYDLDKGIEAKYSSSAGDFWWRQVNTVTRYLVPRNGAQFGLYKKAENHTTASAWWRVQDTIQGQSER